MNDDYLACLSDPNDPFFGRPDLLVDFEADYEPTKEYSDMIKRILKEQRIRAKMPRFGLKPSIDRGAK